MRAGRNDGLSGGWLRGRRSLVESARRRGHYRLWNMLRNQRSEDPASEFERWYPADSEERRKGAALAGKKNQKRREIPRLRRPTTSQERSWGKKSVCFARNDSSGGGRRIAGPGFRVRTWAPKTGRSEERFLDCAGRQLRAARRWKKSVGLLRLECNLGGGRRDRRPRFRVRTWGTQEQEEAKMRLRSEKRFLDCASRQLRRSEVGRKGVALLRSE
jgi:hypothetical protein